jgi:hypothetical protein
MMVMMEPTSLWILFNDLMAKTKTLTLIGKKVAKSSGTVVVAQ